MKGKKAHKFKRILKQIDYRAAVLPFIFLLVGIFFIAFPERSLNILCYILGSLTVLAGAVRFCFSFTLPPSRRFSEIIISGVIIAVGILLLVAPNFIAGFVYVMFGLMLIVDAFLKAEDSFAMRKFDVKNWWIGAVIAAVCLALGIVIIVNPFNTRMLMIFVGIAMLFDSVCSFSAILAKAAYEIRAEDRAAADRSGNVGNNHAGGAGYVSGSEDDVGDDEDEEDDAGRGKNIIDI